MRPPPFFSEIFKNDESFVKDKTTSFVWHRVFTRTLYADTDRSQVVYHANYLRYFELGRASLMRDIGYPYKEVEDSGYVYPVVDTGLTFYKPLYYDEPIWIHTRPSELHTVKVRFDYIITHAESEMILCKGFTIHCALNKSGKPVPVDKKTVHLWQKFSQMNNNIRIPINIEYFPYLKDHCFEGRPVYPAVESLQTLADTVKKHFPVSSVAYSCDVRFFRFLYMPDNSVSINAFVDMEEHEAKSVTVKLLTLCQAKTSRITRIKEHACATFKHLPPLSVPPVDRICSLDGISEKISSKDLYKDMIPFGHAYHNITGDMYLSMTGAVAYIVAAEHSKRSAPLGSPFPLDAAFHAACAWGQRYKGVVAFPVGYKERFILQATIPGHHYYCRVFFISSETDILIFNVWIYSLDGKLHEAVMGLKMQDISGGRMKPPRWVLASVNDPLQNIEHNCTGYTLLEKGSLAPFANIAFSEREKIRFNKLGDKRKLDYLSGRIVLKSLTRKLDLNNCITQASSIETVAEDLVHPMCRIPSNGSNYYCSVSHDDRFAIAVASFNPIGVDVERVSTKTVKGKHLFMNEEEQKMVRISHLGIRDASSRVWSIKEAAAKALDITLTESWKKVKVVSLGEEKSDILINDQQVIAYHAKVDDHIITLLKLQKIGGLD